MSISNERKRAKTKMYIYLGICILCFITMVTAITFHWHRTTIIAVLAGGWASRYYANWRNKYLMP